MEIFDSYFTNISNVILLSIREKYKDIKTEDEKLEMNKEYAKYINQLAFIYAFTHNNCVKDDKFLNIYNDFVFNITNIIYPKEQT